MGVRHTLKKGYTGTYLAPVAFIKSPYNEDNPPSDAATVRVYRMKDVNVPVDI